VKKSVLATMFWERGKEKGRLLLRENTKKKGIRRHGISCKLRKGGKTKAVSSKGKKKEKRRVAPD